MRHSSQSATSKCDWFLNPWWGSQLAQGAWVKSCRVLVLSQVLTEIPFAEIELKDQRHLQCNLKDSIPVLCYTQSGWESLISNINRLQLRSTKEQKRSGWCQLTIRTTTLSVNTSATGKAIAKSVNKKASNSSYFLWGIFFCWRLRCWGTWFPWQCCVSKQVGVELISWTRGNHHYTLIHSINWSDFKSGLIWGREK